MSDRLEFSTLERVLVALFSSILFAAVGFLMSVFLLPDDYHILNEISAMCGFGT